MCSAALDLTGYSQAEQAIALDLNRAVIQWCGKEVRRYDRQLIVAFEDGSTLVDDGDGFYYGPKIEWGKPWPRMKASDI